MKFPGFQLNAKLAADCYQLGYLDDSILLLMRNALYPWYIIVPNTEYVELYQLEHQQQLKILRQVNLISAFLTNHHKIGKINIGSIGNIVSQLHIHVIGRHQYDACWPSVVWGNPATEAYQDNQINRIKNALSESLGHEFEIIS